jgi:membrane-associated phospholipid phosphatase
MTALFDSGWYETATRFAARTGWLHTPVVLFTTYGLVLLVALQVVVWWKARDRDDATMAVALAVPVATLAAFGVDDAVKLVFAEPRPCQVFGDVVTVLPCDPPGDYSFPSDHSALAAAMAVGVLLVHRVLGVVAAVVALAMAASRVYVGAHYPHDVVMGLLVGAIVAAVFCLTARTVLPRFVGQWRRGPLRPLVSAGAPVAATRGGSRWTTGSSCRDRCWRWCCWCSWPLPRW